MINALNRVFIVQPEPVTYGGQRRPPSPLRNATTIDPVTGEVSDTDDGGSINPSEESDNAMQWGHRSHSPTPSVAKFAAGFAQRVGSLMSNVSNRSNGMPTDEELEAEAERERDKSRKEAERIIMQEAEERRIMEQRVMALFLESDGSPNSLPPPPSRSQTMPSPGTPPSPSSSQKDSSWWSMAKSKLTPTKEPLTPAQQIIQETKAREKEIEKEKKKTGKLKEKQKSKEWPSSPDGKFEDPAFMKLGLALTSSPRRPVPASPSSPTPIHKGIPSTPPSLAASPLRSIDGSSQSPSRAPPPLYAQFNAQGTLDVPGTLLTIVKRFEKLEKWTVGHVRALEERMDDVERWLVEKEREKEAKGSNGDEHGDAADVESALNEVREELAEMQGRIGELGREMAKMVTAPGNLSSGPSRNSAHITRAPSAVSSTAVRSISMSSPPASTPPRTSGTTSPPITTPTVSSLTSRTRLPYPTGDYATPPDSGSLNQSPFSPPNSPPSSINSRSRQTSASGPQDTNISPAVNSSTLPHAISPRNSASPPPLQPPKAPGWRNGSVSPTPRKRYTVALGGPIMSANREFERASTPRSRPQSQDMGTAFFSSSPISGDDKDSDTDSDAQEETIGKAAARLSGIAASLNSTSRQGSDGASAAPAARRGRPQSMYAPTTSQGSAAPALVTPLNVRLRSQSSLSVDRAGLEGATVPVTPTSGKFIDPLIIRQQTKEALASSMARAPKVMPGKPKVPVGQLVAYFDKEKKA